MSIRILTGDCRSVLATYAYAAGVIDSDGCIGIRRSTYAARVRGEGTAPIFSTRVCVKQVTPQAVTLLKETFGGSLMMQKPSARNGRPLHYWEIHSRQAVECLRLLIPYLRIKRIQAENCISLYALVERSKKERVAFGRGHAGSASRDPALTAEMETLYVRAKQLNSVGLSQ